MSRTWRSIPSQWRSQACDHPGSVLLESSLPHPAEHHSYLFHAPSQVLSAAKGDQLPALFQAIEQASADGQWAAGYIAYEAGAHFLGLPQRPSTAPLAVFGIYDTPEIFNHRTSPGGGNNPEPLPLNIALMPQISVHEYTSAVHRIQEWITAGDTYQLNYTTRLETPCPHGPLEVYNALLAQQQSSFAAVVNLEKNQTSLSVSPELFFRVDKAGVLTTRPMKGTAPRSPDPVEDARLAAALKQDEKNRAEHVMIVDLLRNDLNRICRIGTVAADDLFHVEQYSTVHQMTSRVSGSLQPGTTWYQVFQALFPGGSITGAPKRHTAELISKVEQHPRGVYTGAIGYIAPDRTACFNIAIRTAVLSATKCDMSSSAACHPEQNGANLTQTARHPKRNEANLTQTARHPKRNEAHLTQTACHPERNEAQRSEVEGPAFLSQPNQLTAANVSEPLQLTAAANHPEQNEAHFSQTARHPEQDEAKLTQSLCHPERNEAQRSAVEGPAFLSQPNQLTSAARHPEQDEAKLTQSLCHPERNEAQRSAVEGPAFLSQPSQLTSAARHPEQDEAKLTQSLCHPERNEAQRSAVEGPAFLSQPNQLTSAARHPQQDEAKLTQSLCHPERNEAQRSAVEGPAFLSQPSQLTPIPRHPEHNEAQRNQVEGPFLQPTSHTLTLGVGGGIVADSTASAEYSEALLKAAFAHRASKPFHLFETMRSQNGRIPLLDEHLQRIVASAGALAFACDPEHLRRTITKNVDRSHGTQRVRIELHRSGHTEITTAEAPCWPVDVRLVLSSVRTSAGSPHLRHKTTFRPEYKDAYLQATDAGFTDALFQNMDGELTETCIANLLVLVESNWYTPSLTSGVLPGVMRAHFLETGQVQERTLNFGDLRSSRAVAVCNALRGIAPVTYLQLASQEALQWPTNQVQLPRAPW